MKTAGLAGGTSMSAGAVSGMLALMQEYAQARMKMTNPSPAATNSVARRQ